MSKHVTIGKRRIVDDRWHDDNGPIPVAPGSWDPPMTDAERHEAALSDPDNPPMTDEQLARLRPVAEIKRLRLSLRLSQAEFARRFQIPLGTLRDWEQHRAEPDQATRAYLKVIARIPHDVMNALAS